MRKQIKIIILSFATMFMFTACSFNTVDIGIEDIPTPSETISTVDVGIEDIPTPSETISTVSPTVTIVPVEQIEEPEEDVKMFSDEEVQAITRTLAGECYDDKLENKQKIVEVILNRVSNEKFGDTVIDVVSAKGQFCGYWKQSRPISESDIRIAEETLERWYANNCEALSDYLFFCAGPNRENIFRVKY